MTSFDSSQSDETVDLITNRLKAAGQFYCTADPADQKSIDFLRALGRRAGRELGWKVRTFVTDPDRREDGMSVVWVVVIESNPLHERLMQARGQKALRRWMNNSALGEDS